MMPHEASFTLTAGQICSEISSHFKCTFYTFELIHMDKEPALKLVRTVALFASTFWHSCNAK